MISRSRRFLSLAGLVLLAGTSLGAAAKEFPGLKDQPVQSVAARLGPPTSEQATAGGTVSTWRVQTRVEHVPVRRTTTEYSAGRPNTTETTVYETQTQTCTVRVTSDAGGIVTAADLDGSFLACGPVTEKLSATP